MATEERFNARLEECRRLRAAFADAGVDYMAGVMEFEADEAAWKSGVNGPFGWTTFSEALHNTSLMLYHRLERFKEAVRVCGGIEEVRKIGTEAAEFLLTIPEDARTITNEPAREILKQEYKAFRERENKEPSRWASQTIATKLGALKKQQVKLVVEKGKPKIENAYDRLVRENRELKARVRELERENAKLLERLNNTLRTASKVCKSKKPQSRVRA